MATLAPRGRIRTEEVEQEKERLTHDWQRPEQPSSQSTTQLSDYLNDEAINKIDPFDRPQLAFVIKTCQSSKSLSEAGRTLFSVSRAQRKSKNDGDRLRKYLARFELTFENL